MDLGLENEVQKRVELFVLKGDLHQLDDLDFVPVEVRKIEVDIDIL